MINLFKKNVCRDCHFLSREFDERKKLTLTENERLKIKDSDFSFLDNLNWSLFCHKGKWDESIHGGQELRNERNRNINDTNRKKCEFYALYQAGATYQSVEIELNNHQKQINDKKQFREKIYLAIISGVIGYIVRMVTNE